MNKKEREKNQYILDIYKKEPVRPKELPYRRVRDDYINELVIEGKIIKRKYGKTYTLLAKPNHEDLCDQRAIKDLHMDARIDVTKQSDIKIRKEIVDRIVIPFERQMSGMIIDDNRIMMSYGTLGKLRSYHVTKLDVEKNPLYPEFVKTCKVIDPNPHLEYERFQQKSKEFFDKYKSISEEIRNIVFTEFVKKTYGKKQMNISKMMHSFTGWIEKELYKLYKKSENEQKNLEELIASGFNKISPPSTQ